MTDAADSASRLRLLYDLGQAFASRLDLEELVPLVVAKCREALGAEGVAVMLLDADRHELYFPYVSQEDPEVAARLLGLRFPVGRGVAGSVVQTGSAVRIDDVSADPRYYSDVDRTSGLTTRAMLAAPLASAHGPIGVITAVNRVGGGTFTDTHLGLLEALAGSVAGAIENARRYGRMKDSAERLGAELGALRRDLARRDRFPEIVGTSPVMAEVFALMESAGASPISVLIEGETGTGKELVARGIHAASVRAAAPFVAVNCAALPETLLESELFGHRRGAFTGATQDRRGIFEAADGGTIFLDEVGEMPLAMQAKLLRTLQEGEVTPIGDTRPRRVDVRVISATNRDLAAGIAAKTVRPDLYYRIAAFPIRVPPLRDRRDDVPLLVERFVARAAERHRKRIAGVAEAALEQLVAFDWPGNVRELENEIERAVALARDGDALETAQLSPKLRTATPADAAAGGSRDDARGPLRRARAAFEARYIAEALRRHGGNVSHTAQALGLSRVMLQKKMKAFDLR